jgi:antirestriction protein ArdC
MDEALERRAYSGTHHQAATPQRHTVPLSERIENADRFMTNTAATIQHGGNRAFYAPVAGPLIMSFFGD